MRLAAIRAVALETSRGWRIAKEKASHKIDPIVALAQAVLGAVKQGQESITCTGYQAARRVRGGAFPTRRQAPAGRQRKLRRAPRMRRWSRCEVGGSVGGSYERIWNITICQ